MIFRLPPPRPTPRPWRVRRAAVAVLFAAVSLACNRPEPRPHESLDPALTALRTQFNAEADRTRLLMIVAPT